MKNTTKLIEKFLNRQVQLANQRVINDPKLKSRIFYCQDCKKEQIITTESTFVNHYCKPNNVLTYYTEIEYKQMTLKEIQHVLKSPEWKKWTQKTS